MARRRSSFPPPLPNLVRTEPIEGYQTVRDSAPLPLACNHLPRGTRLAFGRGAHLGNTVLNKPYGRRLSTHRLNRENSYLAASLEGEPGPTSAGKTLPHSYLKTKFRKERARVTSIIPSHEYFFKLKHVLILPISFKTLSIDNIALSYVLDRARIQRLISSIVSDELLGATPHAGQCYNRPIVAQVHETLRLCDWVSFLQIANVMRGLSLYGASF